ncbi:MAG TPA: winged helix DNA-binding domain-containing protein [Micromonosporaceae bacterium]|nr:winged helix DNA-binding domain-containing protein [Micromonosporaceae bacterium]
MRRIDAAQRRARLGVRHRLAAPGDGGLADVARSVVALHATDPASVFLAAWARLRDPQVKSIERELYDERQVLRMLGMRRTMFVAPVETAPVVQAACTRAVARRERRMLVQLLERAGFGAGRDVAAWLAEVEESTARLLARRGEATAAELAQDEPRLRERVVLGAGTSSEAAQNLTTKVLFLLAADGRIVRGRPRGSWVSSQYRWASMESWVPGGLAEVPVDEAQAALARAWLAAFGPGTATDLRWWTGWTAAEVKRALARVGAVAVALDEGTGYVLPDDVDPVPAGEPWAALLPALDPTPMGWAGRDWFLGGHRTAIFDRTGNIGPSVWWDGRVVGGWAQRGSGEVAFRLLEDVGAQAGAAIAAAARRLGGWLGPVRVTPRFRTPLERELRAQAP